MIDTRIKTARAKIGDSGCDQKYIEVYSNRGYKFIGEIEGKGHVINASTIFALAYR